MMPVRKMGGLKCHFGKNRNSGLFIEMLIKILATEENH